MFKKALLSLALVFALATTASAADNGFYLGLKFLDSIQSTGTISSSGNADFFDTSEYSQNTVGGGIFMGYDFYPTSQVPVRAELEYAIRSNSETTWDNKDTGVLPSGVAEAKARWNLQTLFLNAYWDFHNDTAFTPYIGGGIGLGFINSRYEVSIPALNWEDSKEETQTVFAWNLGVGVSYAFNENFSADLAYRFVGLGYNETDLDFAGSDAKLGLSPYANEFSLGLRYTF